MKRSAFLLIFALLYFQFSPVSNSQTINQKLITGILTGNSAPDAYSLKYDAATGGWVYTSYDTVTTQSTIITPSGTSKPFTYAMTYNALFDGDGNSYVIGSESISDTVYKYSILKNSEVIATYDNIPDGWVMKEGILYYSAQEGGKHFLVSYNTKTGAQEKSKAYDEIRLAYTPDGYSEGEPIGYIGFTKAGKLYYIASSNGETFLVIGDEEQKHYSDITWYDLKFNQQDEPCYIAKSQGKFYDERGNTFMVRGNKEYKTFDWIYGPVEFDNSGMPIYTGQDSIDGIQYRNSLMKGDEVVATVNGSIYNYMYTPEGKFAYVVSSETPGKNDEAIWTSYIVVDGKKGKEFYSVNNPVFGSSGNVMYSASDKNGKYFVVKNNKVISEKYDYISEVKFLPNGKSSYVGVTYGNYDKKIPDKSYVVIGDDEFGPYNTVNTSDWKTNSMVLTDSRGNYAYMAGDLVDYASYTYKYMVYSNKGESKQFDNMSDLNIINGKTCYFAGNMKGKDTYVYDYTLYIDNKKIGDTYSSYSDVNIKDGVMTFIASKGNDIYFCEVKP